MMKLVIEIRNLVKIYKVGEIEVPALKGVDLTVRSGEFVAIMGPSGSGKSTLMNLIGCLDRPTSGEYFLEGIEVSKLHPNDYAEIRNQKIGFVFQGFNLLPRTSALENVELPLFYNRKNQIHDPQKKAREVLSKVGLGGRIHHEPNQLSGGEQQRVAIARALINSPSLLLADEPTGNLDSKTSVEIMSLFQELNDQGITILLVTHEHDISHYAKRILEMRDGRILRDYPVRKRLIAKEVLASLKEEVS